MNQTEIKEKTVIEAAGGVVWHKGSSSDINKAEKTSSSPKKKVKIAIVHRPQHNDWSLPKGKREPDESWQETALREVQEETGCPVQLGDFISSVSYTVKGRPKIVLFWLMTTTSASDCILEPNHEVDRVKWVSPPRALKLLTYKGERTILRQAVKLILKKRGK